MTALGMEIAPQPAPQQDYAVVREKIRTIKAIGIFQDLEQEAAQEVIRTKDPNPAVDDYGKRVHAVDQEMKERRSNATRKERLNYFKTIAAEEKLSKLLQENKIPFDKKALQTKVICQENDGSILSIRQDSLMNYLAEKEYNNLPLLEKVKYQIKNEHPFLSAAVVTTLAMWVLYAYQCYKQSYENDNLDDIEAKTWLEKFKDTGSRIFTQMKAQSGKSASRLLASVFLLGLGYGADGVRMLQCYDKDKFNELVETSTAGLRNPFSHA